MFQGYVAILCYCWLVLRGRTLDGTEILKTERVSKEICLTLFLDKQPNQRTWEVKHPSPFTLTYGGLTGSCKSGMKTGVRKEWAFPNLYSQGASGTYGDGRRGCPFPGSPPGYRGALRTFYHLVTSIFCTLYPLLSDSSLSSSLGVNAAFSPSTLIFPRPALNYTVWKLRPPMQTSWDLASHFLSLCTIRPSQPPSEVSPASSYLGDFPAIPP